MSQPSSGTPNPNAEFEAEARERREAQLKEYGEYVAIEEIRVGSALAFMPGHPVPKSHVESYSYLDQGLVARRTTKAAKEVTGEAAASSGSK